MNNTKQIITEIIREEIEKFYIESSSNALTEIPEIAEDEIVEFEMTEEINKSQHILYLYTIRQNDAVNDLLSHIDKMKVNSYVHYFSNKNSRAEQSKILEYLDCYNIDTIVNFDALNYSIELNFLSKIKFLVLLTRTQKFQDFYETFQKSSL